MSNTIEPIGASQRREVEAATADCVARISRALERDFPVPPVRFDLRGRSAGMFRSDGQRHWIRYNPWIFAKYYRDNLEGTVPHEVAHYIVHLLYGRRRVAPHGREWRAVMDLLGAPPEVTFDRDLSDIPQRRQRTHSYHCACREHALSTTRHNRVRRGSGRYLCRACGEALRPGSGVD
ncbi:SprT-like domain-containing protein [Parahaliea aestuarii]|uniref:SprT family zinc-dependent metalloprotease n=1 Tax=Parahaliea aestuarii TaxID=1852021 RepID=UPI001FE4CF4E|nr:SprT-like domain-containing protein [Parahaliea aestuarii]